MAPAPATPKGSRTPRRNRASAAGTPAPTSPKPDATAAAAGTPPSRKRRRASDFASKSAKRRSPRTRSVTPSRKPRRGADRGTSPATPARETELVDGEIDDMIRNVRSLIDAGTPAPGKQLRDALLRADKEFRTDITPPSSDDDGALATDADKATAKASSTAAAAAAAPAAALPLALPQPFTPPRADESVSAQKRQAKTPASKRKQKRVAKKNAEDDDSDFESSAQTHRADIDALKKDDPEFYKFLEENDGSLLDFDGVSESDADGENEAPQSAEDVEERAEDDTTCPETVKTVKDGKNKKKAKTPSKKQETPTEKTPERKVSSTAEKQSAKKAAKKSPKSARKQNSNTASKAAGENGHAASLGTPTKPGSKDKADVPQPTITEAVTVAPVNQSVGTTELHPEKTPKRTLMGTSKPSKGSLTPTARKTPGRISTNLRLRGHAEEAAEAHAEENDEGTTADDPNSSNKHSGSTPLKSAKKAKRASKNTPLKTVALDSSALQVQNKVQGLHTPEKAPVDTSTPRKTDLASSSKKKKKRQPSIRSHPADDACKEAVDAPSAMMVEEDLKTKEVANTTRANESNQIVSGITESARRPSGSDQTAMDSDSSVKDVEEREEDDENVLVPTSPVQEASPVSKDQDKITRKVAKISKTHDSSEEEDEESSPIVQVKIRTPKRKGEQKNKQSPKRREADVEMIDTGAVLEESDVDFVDSTDAEEDEDDDGEQETADAKAALSAEVAELNGEDEGPAGDENLDDDDDEEDIMGYTDNSEVDYEEEEEEAAAAAAAGISLEAEEMDEEFVEDESLGDEDTGLDEDESDAEQDENAPETEEETQNAVIQKMTPKLLVVDMKYLRNMKQLLSSKRAGVKACKDLLRVFRAGRDVLPTASPEKKKEQKRKRRRPTGEQDVAGEKENEDDDDEVEQDEFNDDGSFTAGSITFASAKAYQQAMNLAIVGIQDSLDRMLGKPQKDEVSRSVSPGWNPTNSGRWSSLETVFRPYVYHMFALCEAMEDASTLRFLLKRLEKMLPYTSDNKSLLKKAVRFAISIFSSEAHNVSEATRLRAYLLLNHMAHGDGNTETVLRSCYNMYSTNIAATCNPKSLPFIQFSTSCLVELFGIDIGASYTVAFSYLREMAVSLRTVLISKSIKEDVERIHNWSYINQLRLWSKVLSKYGSEDELQPLIYPFVQVSLGIMKVYPTPRTYPLRLHIASFLSDVVAQTGTFIPVVPHLLYLLRCSELRKVPKHGDTKSLDWSSLLRVSDDVVKTKPFLTGLVNNFVLQISKFFTSISKHVSFPEISHIVEVTLKKTAKELSAMEWKQKLSALADKLKQTSTAIAVARGMADFSPNGAVSPKGMLAVVPGIDPKKKMPIQVFFEVEKERVSKEERLRNKPGSTSGDGKPQNVGDVLSDSDDEDEQPKKRAKSKKKKKTVRSLLSIPGDVGEEDQLAELNLESDSD